MAIAQYPGQCQALRIIPSPIRLNTTQIANTVTWNPPSSGTFGGPAVPLPDPSTDMDVIGLAISAIVLPNNTQWTFTYANTTTLTTTNLVGYSAGDLLEVTTPSGGTVTYTYTTIPAQSPLGIGRCNAVCHAVYSRTETDGLGNQWTTYYSYATQVPTGLPSSLCPEVTVQEQQVVFDFATTETDPSGNDTVHTFCAPGMVSGVTPIANQYHEVETQYYQGSISSNKLIKTVQTGYEYQYNFVSMVNGTPAGVINVLPRACFINRYGLKLGSLHEHVALMNWMHEQEAIRVVERCAVGVGRAAAA